LSENRLIFGITIRASEAARSFLQLVHHASAFEHEPSIRSLNYAPHLTLERYEAIDRALLIAGLEVFRDAPPITLTFDHIGLADRASAERFFAENALMEEYAPKLSTSAKYLNGFLERHGIMSTFGPPLVDRKFFDREGVENFLRNVRLPVRASKKRFEPELPPA
jgi:hypothetical protein